MRARPPALDPLAAELPLDAEDASGAGRAGGSVVSIRDGGIQEGGWSVLPQGGVW